ncbi:TPA: hypothetical protein I8Z04_000986 [Legionella pneumophila]|nr:hypothetical protein [Legionella pneumophila]
MTKKELLLSELTENPPGLLKIREQKAVTAIIENYVCNQVNYNNLTPDEKNQKVEAYTKAITLFASSLGANGVLQNMLAIQLLGIHELQQKMLPYANRSIHSPEYSQYFINSITKLSNTFIQQLNTLQKLQANSHQKVTVEHLHVNAGGQAIVGQVNTHKKDIQ